MGAAKRSDRRAAVRPGSSGVRSGRPVSVLAITTTTSGWNDDERTLASANVSPVSFGQLFNL